MAEQSYPFDAGAGAAVNEAQWQAMARRFRQTGVIDGSLNKLLVSADGSALSVSVASGDAFVEGFFYRNDAALALTIATANATNPRIDTVVVRLDRVANSAVLAVVTGTAAASPVAPTLSATDSLYELPLANVLVPAAAGVIVSGNVTDRRTLTQTFDSAAYVAKADVTTGVVDTQESTTSTAYVDLATVGPTVTLVTGTRVLVLLSGDLQNTTASAATLMAFAISGATTRAVDENQRLNIVSSTSGANFGIGTAFIVTGLTAGSNTFTAKYRVGSGTGFYSRRRLVVIPL